MSDLPEPLPTIAGVLPSTQMVRLARSVLVYHVESPGPLLPGIAALLGWAVCTYAIGVVAFRWHRRG